MANILIYCLLFFLPSQFGKFFFLDSSYIDGVRVDYLAPVIYLTDILFILLLFFNIKTLIKVFKTLSLKKNNYNFVIAFFLIIFINLLVSENKIITIFRFVKILEVFLLYLIIKAKKLDYIKIYSVLALSSFLELALVLYQVIQGKSLQGAAWFFGERLFNIATPGIAKVSIEGVEVLRGYGTFSHPNSLAGFYFLIYVFVLFFSPKKYIEEKNWMKFNIIKQILLGVSTLLVVFSFSKIAILGLLFFTLLYYAWFKLDCLLCKMSKIIIPLFLVFFVFFTKGDSFSIQKRIYLANSSFEIISQNPFFGTGLGNYLYKQAEIISPYTYFFLQPVHNIFLLFISEIGVPIFLILLFFLFKNLSGQKLSIYNAWLMTFLAVFYTGFFDHYWLTLQQNILLLPVVFGLLANDSYGKINVARSQKQIAKN